MKIMDFSETIAACDLKFDMTFVQIAQFDWLPGQHKWFIFEKVCFSKTISRLKAKICMHVYGISD